SPCHYSLKPRTAQKSLSGKPGLYEVHLSPLRTRSSSQKRYGLGVSRKETHVARGSDCPPRLLVCASETGVVVRAAACPAGRLLLAGRKPALTAKLVRGREE